MRYKAKRYLTKKQQTINIQKIRIYFATKPSTPTGIRIFFAYLYRDRSKAGCGLFFFYIIRLDYISTYVLSKIYICAKKPLV